MKLTLLDLVIFPVAFGFGFLANFAEAATFKLFWSWIIVDMFPNAVTQGLIVNSVSWVITLKIAVFFFIIRLIKALDKAYVSRLSRNWTFRLLVLRVCQVPLNA